MQAKLNYTNIGPRLKVTKPITSHISSEYLMTLSPRQRMACVYKRMFKLRFMVGDSQSQQNDYRNLIRRRFSRQDFNVRRNMLLGLDEKLPEESLAKRLANTYAFVFNATCEMEGPIPEVNFYDDLKDALDVRHETKVLRTMLMMERETPSSIKYDHTYSWVEDVRRFYAQFKEDMSNKEYNKLATTKSAHHIGFYQYEQTLASLNETLFLCL